MFYGRIAPDPNDLSVVEELSTASQLSLGNGNHRADTADN